MSKVQYSASMKFAVLQEIEIGQIGVMDAAKKYGINKSTLTVWRGRYEMYGYEGLEIRTHNRCNSAELKFQAVQDYLSGQFSQNEIIDKYKIASRTQLRSWVDKYNSHSSLKGAGPQHGRRELRLFTTAVHMNMTIRRQRAIIKCLINKCTNGSRNTKQAGRMPYRIVEVGISQPKS